MAFIYGNTNKCQTADGVTRNEYECRLGYQVNNQDITNNTSNITLRLEVRSISASYKTYGYNQTTTIDGTTLSAQTFDMRNTNAWQLFGERTFDIQHNSDGTYSSNKSGSFTTTATSTYSLKSGSASVTVNPDTIPRASEIGVLDANIAASTSITINKLSDAFTTSLYYKAAGQSEWTLIVDKTNLYVYPWTVPSSFYALIPNSKTIICQFKAVTYSGTTQVGEKTASATFTATGSPVIDSVTLTDTNSTTVALTGDNTKMVKTESNVQVSVIVHAQNSASIISVKVNNQTATLSNGVATITFNKSSTNVFEIIVTDSRNYKTEDSRTMVSVDYIPLSLDAVVKRNSALDGIVKIIVSGNYFNGSFGNTSNTLIVQYRYKESTSSSYGSWTSMSPTISNNAYSQTLLASGFDYQKKYDMQIRAVDQINTKPVTGIEIKKGVPIVWWNGEKFVVTGDLEVLGTIIN